MKEDIELLKNVSRKLGAYSAVLITRCKGNENTVFDDRYIVTTYGDTKENGDIAALDGQKLMAVLESRPTSLEEAVGVADKVRSHYQALEDAERILFEIAQNADHGNPRFMAEDRAKQFFVFKYGTWDNAIKAMERL